jgi:hypothetical protein
MIGTASLSFDHASEQVEGMVQHGTAFTRVEDAIDAAQLSNHHKAALWLLAWSLREPSLQRREARLMAQAITTDDHQQSAEHDRRPGRSHGPSRSAVSSPRQRCPLRRR